ncbi:MAG: M48 family metallopeptidase [Xenococcaceae cyanobacterium MO_188.B19]|nr:M48 family metallopeptidase [Xenococcaceae cyanobacterium MO_188.B19]
MKFYTSLFPIIIFSSLFTSNLTVAEIPPKTETETTTTIESEANTATSESEIETPESEVSVEKSPECEEINHEKPESKTTTEAEAQSEAETPKTQCPTVADIIRYQKLAAADELYLKGDTIASTLLYQEAKESWNQEGIEINRLPKPIYDINKLSPGGSVYWRIYQQGKKQNLESKIFVPLELLVTKNPEFIPGHIAYAQELREAEKSLQAIQTLETAIGLYPKEVELLRSKIATDITEKRWLDATISARQFALLNAEHPKAEEFENLADEYLEEYQDYIRSELTANAIGNAIVGTLGFALTGNIFGPISALDTTIMLLQGESSLGTRFSKRLQEKLPMLEDEAVLTYVRDIGNKLTEVSGRDEFEYEFHVIMDDRLNAFALPGGKIFVNAGAIMNTDSEAELAGLLAHEIAHSDLSHGFQLATRASLTSNVFQYIPYIGGTAGNLIVLNYSRDMERQADIFGTKMLTAADYAADGVRNLMVELAEQNDDEENPPPPAWLSTHPDTEKRVKYLENMIISNNLNRYAYEGVEKHQEIKKIVSKLWKEYKAEQEKNKEEKPEPIRF